MNNHDLRFSSNGFSCHNKLDTHGKKLQLKIRRNYEKQLEPKCVAMAFPGKSEATVSEAKAFSSTIAMPSYC